MALRGKNTIFGPFVTLFKAKLDRDKTQKVFSSEGLVTRDRTLGRFSTVLSCSNISDCCSKIIKFFCLFNCLFVHCIPSIKDFFIIFSRIVGQWN
jgi:hypothetical protein